MKNKFQFSMLAGLALTYFSSCALFTNEVVIKEPPKPLPEKMPVVVAPPVHHEPGSLWAENSKWNELFSSTTGRNVGDLIFIRTTEAFKGLISSKPDRLGQSANEYLTSAARESNLIVVTIKQIHPQGIYSIKGDQQIKIRGRNQTVSISGKVRERDIGNDDSASSEAVFDMNLEVDGNDIDPEKIAAIPAVPDKYRDPAYNPDKGRENEKTPLPNPGPSETTKAPSVAPNKENDRGPKVSSR